MVTFFDTCPSVRTLSRRLEAVWIGYWTALLLSRALRCLITPRTTLNHIVSHYIVSHYLVSHCLVLFCTASCCLALPRTSSYWHALPPIAFYSASNCWPTAALECNGQAVWLTKPCPSVWTRIRLHPLSVCTALCTAMCTVQPALGSADLQANLQERKRVKSGQIVEKSY